MSEQESGASGGGKFDALRQLRQLRGRGGAEYLDVTWRLVWLRSEHPDAQVATEHVTITSDMAIFKAQVTIPGAGSATGYGSESAKEFGDFIEKAETKALGRALIALGYGTQFAQELDEADHAESASPVRAMPSRADSPRPERPEPVRPEPPAARQMTTPQAATAPRQPVAPLSPRPEPIPADTRRPAPMRPLRDAEPDLPAAVASEEVDEDPFDLSPARSPEPAPQAVPHAPLRPSPIQPAPRPAPRPIPAPAPAFTREPVEDAGEDEVIDMANYGWTEFWSWARARGFNDRKSLDAVVGRPTNGMTPLEIRKQIQAKQG